ncbi:MAG: 23S rRNA (uridine(2552)-2'-O)-methyltransferase RlmE [Pseudomonadales bacterium]|nr:23S rRNA (uridine(2552)-2'-O)-methyltransferase RlmE [Pseudomonadales bacterium]
MTRSKTSKGWLKEHFDDAWVKKAQEEGYRSRASYKLLEIQDKDKLIRPGMRVVDLGAAPGGWSQVATKLVGLKGKIIATDILPMDSIEDVEIIRGDFTEEAVLDNILHAVGSAKVDLVISDMAPNISGMSAVDQPKAMYLADLALDFARKVLVPEGVFLTKVFQGEGIELYRSEIKQCFTQLIARKPAASRPRSKELYLIGKGFKGD